MYLLLHSLPSQKQREGQESPLQAHEDGGDMGEGEIQGEPRNGCSLEFRVAKEQLALSWKEVQLWGVRRPGFESRLCPNGDLKKYI